MTLLDDLTFEERSAVEELRQRTLQDLTPGMLEDPYVFYRFSKARNFNLKQSEAMLRKHIAWRQKHNIDNILTDCKVPEVFKKYVATTRLGFDKEGSTVRYLCLAGTDMKGIKNSARVIDFLNYHFQTMEGDMITLKEQSEKLGKPVTKMVYIYDFNKMTFAKATYKPAIEFMIWVIKEFQDNYPERIKSVYIINTSIYFNILFSMLKVFVAASLMEKVQMFGTDGWKEALLKTIDADVLPGFLGGNRTDPDGNPLCKTFVVHGGLVPEHYYLSNSKKSLNQEPGVKSIKVPRCSSTNIVFDIAESGSILEWEFETKCKDIGFGLCFRNSIWPETKLVELIPKQRIDTCSEPETGQYKCEKSGTYIIIFDNSYSWIYLKEIYYRTNVLPPSEQDLQ